MVRSERLATQTQDFFQLYFSFFERTASLKEQRHGMAESEVLWMPLAVFLTINVGRLAKKGPCRFVIVAGKEMLCHTGQQFAVLEMLFAQRFSIDFSGLLKQRFRREI